MFIPNKRYEKGDFVELLAKIEVPGGIFEKNTLMKIVGSSYRGYSLIDIKDNKVVDVISSDFKTTTQTFKSKEVIELHHLRHFILYAKGHYVKGDLKEDIEKIIAEYTGTELKYINFYDTWNILSDEILSIFHSYTEGFKFAEFIRLISPEQNWQIGGAQTHGYFSGIKIEGVEPEEYWVRVIRVCLHNLKFMKVYDKGIQLINLGEPDLETFKVTECSRKMFTCKERN